MKEEATFKIYLTFSISRFFMSWCLWSRPHVRHCHEVGCQESSGDGLTSEEVHEVFSYVAVGREDLADARGTLGPRLPWWALDCVGHSL